MDVLRSAHVTRARVGSDNGREAELRWYKCAPGAKAFPAFHAFGSPVWEPFPDEWTQGPGVYLEPLRWVTSRLEAPPGTEYHGRAEWYLKGIPQAILDHPDGHTTPPCIREKVVWVGEATAAMYAAVPRTLPAVAWASVFPSPPPP